MLALIVGTVVIALIKLAINAVVTHLFDKK